MADSHDTPTIHPTDAMQAAIDGAAAAQLLFWITTAREQADQMREYRRIAPDFDQRCADMGIPTCHALGEQELEGVERLHAAVDRHFAKLIEFVGQVQRKS